MTAEHTIGVDIGGTKCAAGLVRTADGQVLVRRLQPTSAERGGRAVLGDVIRLVRSLQEESARLGIAPVAAGLGIAELVSPEGAVLSAATIPWKGVDVQEEFQRLTGLPVRVEADVRAAARAEAHLGAGRGFASFLFVTVGTGISASLVIDGEPYVGARGLTGTFASSRTLIPDDNGNLVAGPPLEQFAAGPALAARFASVRNDRPYEPSEVVALCETGDAEARRIVASAGESLGAAVAQLINVFDPQAVVLGGGLGLVGGQYRHSLRAALHEYVWSEIHREVALLPAALGVDAGFIGAALAAKGD
jgi:glucokinase